MLSTNILLSGNNFRKIALLLRFMRMGCCSHTFFDQVQHYAVPCVNQYYTDTITGVREQLKERGKHLILAGKF